MTGSPATAPAAALASWLGTPVSAPREHEDPAVPGGGATVAGVALLVDGDAFQETSALDGEPVVGERGRGEVAMLVDLELMEVATHEARFEAGGDGELHPVVGVVAAGDGALLAISGDRERLVEAEPLVVPVD